MVGKLVIPVTTNEDDQKITDVLNTCRFIYTKVVDRFELDFAGDAARDMAITQIQNKTDANVEYIKR